MGEDVEDVFSLTFQITEEVFGERQFVNLKPNGDQIPVTNENRQGNKMTVKNV
jgi:E3 ubiquitin-protein ligase NEDD4